MGEYVKRVRKTNRKKRRKAVCRVGGGKADMGELGVGLEVFEE